MSSTTHHPDYTGVWLCLMGLMLASLAVGNLGLSAPVAAALIFLLAGVKALLVALYFMHLRFEQIALAGILLAPLALFAVLLLVLIPEFVSTAP